MPFQLIKGRATMDSRSIRPQGHLHSLVCYFSPNIYCLATLADLSPPLVSESYACGGRVLCILGFAAPGSADTY